LANEISKRFSYICQGNPIFLAALRAFRRPLGFCAEVSRRRSVSNAKNGVNGVDGILYDRCQRENKKVS
jgi:hypothetical protein